MPIEPIRLENIEIGDCIEAVNAAIAEVAHDIEERYRLEKPRTVTLVVTLNPHTKQIDRNNHRTFCDIDWAVKKSLPAMAGITTTAFMNGGKMLVNTDDPSGADPSQPTIFDIAREKGASAQ